MAVKRKPTKKTKSSQTKTDHRSLPRNRKPNVKRQAKNKELSETKPAERIRANASYKRLRSARIQDTRDRIDTSACLNTIAEVENELLSISTSLRDGVAIDADGNVLTSIEAITECKTRVHFIPKCSEYEERVYRLRILALEKRSDIAFKKLRKVLPDLQNKTPKDNNNPQQQLADSLNQIMQKYN